MDAAGTEGRTWCGAPIPPEVETLPHPTALRFVRPLPRWVQAFRVVWCSLVALMCVPIAIAGFPAGLCFVAPLLLAGAFVATRPSRITITFRPGRRWVTFASPTSWAARPHGADDVGIEIERDEDGWTARLHLRGTTLATVGPDPDRDRVAARLLPLADAIRREMGGTPLPPP